MDNSESWIVLYDTNANTALGIRTLLEEARFHHYDVALAFYNERLSMRERNTWRVILALVDTEVDTLPF